MFCQLDVLLKTLHLVRIILLERFYPLKYTEFNEDFQGWVRWVSLPFNRSLLIKQTDIKDIINLIKLSPSVNH